MYDCFNPPITLRAGLRVIQTGQEASMTSDPAAPHGRDAQGRALAPFGRKDDGTIRLRPGRGKRHGTIEKTKTGWRARYTAPDGSRPSKSFSANEKTIAQAWLDHEFSAIARGEWKSVEQLEAERAAEAEQRQADGYTVAEWAEEWLRRLKRTGRTAKTVQTHRYRINAHVIPDLGTRPLRAITEDEVTAWYDRKHSEHGSGVTRALVMTVRAMLNEAVKAGRLDRSPVDLPGTTKYRATKTGNHLATSDQVAALALAMPEHLCIAVHLAAWCQLRIGEVLELRRRDLDLKAGVLKVSRQVQHIQGVGPVVTPPKSEAGTRVVTIPAPLIPVLKDHIAAHAGPGRGGLIVPHPEHQEKHLHPNTFRTIFNRARTTVAGLDGFKFHDLRHTGLTEFARQGATARELMRRGGHKDIAVAMGYQHAEQNRDRTLTEGLAARVVIATEADVIPLKRNA